MVSPQGWIFSARPKVVSAEGIHGMLSKRVNG